MNRLLEMSAFAEVVEQGSFTAAAERLGVSKSFVSKQVSALEEELGVKLLRRTTRRLVLTDEGRLFLDYCRRVRDTADEGIKLVQSQSHEVAGPLRVSAPLTFGQIHMAELVERFSDRFPEVEIDLILENRRIDLNLENVDVAVRITESPPLNLSVTPVGLMEDVICAAPSYLERRGAPEEPEELTEHRCLIYLNPIRMRRWTFRKERRVRVVEVSGATAYNTHQAMTGPLLEGIGIGKLPEYFVRHLLREKRLVRLFPDYQCDQLPIYLVHHELGGQPPRVRKFVDFLRQSLEGKDNHRPELARKPRFPGKLLG